MAPVRAGLTAGSAAASVRRARTPAPARKRVTVLGATGSVGTSTLDLIGRNPQLFEVVALTAHSNVEALAELAVRHRAALAVIADDSRYGALKERLAGSGIEVAAGAAGLIEAAVRPADCVMAASSAPPACARRWRPSRKAGAWRSPTRNAWCWPARSSWRRCARPAPSWCRSTRSTRPSSSRSPAPIPPPSSASC